MSLEDQLYPLLDSYNALPHWLRSTLGTAYRHLPHGWRYGARYAEFKELAVAGEQWSEFRLISSNNSARCCITRPITVPFTKSVFCAQASGPKMFTALKT